jgi:hypothetical protein
VTLEDLGHVGELIAAVATVATLIYLAIQIRASNRLARAEATRSPSSDLNALNAAFGTDPTYLGAWRKVLAGASRDELEPGERTAVDLYLISVTNVHEQLVREVREGTLAADALDFRGTSLFLLPYYRTSWAHYRNYLSATFVKDWESRFGLDPSLKVNL